MGSSANPNDDHPNTGIAKGQAFLAQVYSDVIANFNRWARTMMVITYDEHGGFFDHVAPLPVPTTAGVHPFTTSGLRVPGFVVSPQVQAGRVFNRNLDHTAILELLAEKFTPGHGYSVAVNSRQGFIDRLSNTLEPIAAAPRSPPIPTETLAAINSAADAAVTPPAPPPAADDPANTRAFRETVLKAQREHPDLMAHPSWTSDQIRLTKSS